MTLRPLAPVVDLARERRLRALDSELGELLARRPDLADRTRAMLASELPCPDLEDLEDRMAINDAATQLRLPAEALARAEALIPALEAEPMLQAVGRGVSRSSVLRLAVLRGLDSLEKEYGKPRRRK